MILSQKEMTIKMANENKIGHREAMALLTVIISGKVFLSFPRDMALLGDAAGWLIIILAGLFSLIGFYFLNALLTRFPSKNLIEISLKVTGPFFGSIFGLAIFFFFLVMTSLVIRMVAELFILSVLPRTPISIIMLFFLGLLVYGTLLGIETISRVAWFYGPYLLLALLAILGFTLPRANPVFLTPILGPGPLPLLKNSFIYTSMFAEILLLGLIAPLIRKKEKIFGVGLFSILISTFAISMVTLVSILVFNYIAVSRLVFPTFQLARLITFGEFVQRVESVFVFMWFFSAGIQLGGLFYASVVSFAGTFQIKNYRPIVFPMAILVFCLSLIPASMTETLHINDFILSGFYLLVGFGIPFLLWLISTIFKKRLGESNG
jgi:spore germination protein KB